MDFGRFGAVPCCVRVSVCGESGRGGVCAGFEPAEMDSNAKVCGAVASTGSCGTRAEMGGGVVFVGRAGRGAVVQRGVDGSDAESMGTIDIAGQFVADNAELVHSCCDGTDGPRKRIVCWSKLV